MDNMSAPSNDEYTPTEIDAMNKEYDQMTADLKIDFDNAVELEIDMSKLPVLSIMEAKNDIQEVLDWLKGAN